jgi:ATP-dependent protease ClpP protease subunit
MKARLVFYCIAVVALVLFLAATSRATERRDPVLNPEQATVSGHATDAARHAQHRTHPKKTTHAAKDAHAQASQKNPNSGAGSSSKGK